MNRRLSTTKILGILISFLLVFVSVDNNVEFQNNFTLIFRRTFDIKIIFLGGLNYFEMILLLFSFILLHQASKQPNNSISKGLFLLLIIYILDTIFFLINPNDSVIYYADRFVILLFLFALIKLNAYQYSHLIYSLFIYIFIFTIIKVLILYALYYYRYQIIYLHGSPSINTEEDTNLLITFIGILSFMLFLYRKKSIYLIFYLVFLFFLFLTYRRTGFLTFLLGSAIAFSMSLYYARKSIRITARKLVIFFLLIIGFAYTFNQLMSTSTGQLYIGRYFDAFFDLNISYSATDFRNYHLEQSAWAAKEALKKLPFWGVGRANMDNLPIVYGTSRGIHNAYVSQWMIYSFGNLLCIVFTIILFIFYSIKSMKVNNRLVGFLYLKTAIIAFLVIFFINLWVLPLWNWNPTQTHFFRILLLTVLIRSNDIEMFINKYRQASTKFLM